MLTTILEFSHHLSFPISIVKLAHRSEATCPRSPRRLEVEPESESKANVPNH